jgi:thymidylate synthase ThyX
MKANIREWRHIFWLRAIGASGKPHPQMEELMIPLLEELKELVPVVFEDIT